MHVVVIVLGDLGRSPRMQYHAQSLLEAHHDVTVIGYEGEALVPGLSSAEPERLDVIRLSPRKLPQPLQRIVPLRLLWRLVSLTCCLVWALWGRVGRPPRTSRREARDQPPPVDCVLVQNPPAVPLLLTTCLYCRLYSLSGRHRHPRLIIDWHNLGYTMFGTSSIVLRSIRSLARRYEATLAPLADEHLTVTQALQDFLRQQWIPPSRSNTICVLHDCPGPQFRPLTLPEQHELWSRLERQLHAACPRDWYANLSNGTRNDTAELLLDQTLFTEKHRESMDVEFDYRPRKGRPALVTSSTSWTPDEDFGILLDALVLLEERIQRESTVDDSGDPLRVLVVVTGKGPQKEEYERRFSKLAMEYVAIQTVWLEPDDYPRLLACADVTVSLHTSTSGLDLPMKILDSFGCHVPVCAVTYPCLERELMQDEAQGRLFRTREELSQQLWELLSPLNREPAPCHGFGALAEYSSKLREQQQTWHDNWVRNALPLLEGR